MDECELHFPPKAKLIPVSEEELNSSEAIQRFMEFYEELISRDKD